MWNSLFDNGCGCVKLVIGLFFILVQLELIRVLFVGLTVRLVCFVARLYLLMKLGLNLLGDYLFGIPFIKSGVLILVRPVLL